MKTQGYIEFSNEIFALVNNINILLTSSKGKPSIAADQRAVDKIKANPLFYKDERERRKIMSLYIASSFKQTL